MRTFFLRGVADGIFCFQRDAALLQSRLAAFLDSFRDSYSEWTADEQPGSFVIDKVYGDCTEILTALLGIVEVYTVQSQDDGASPPQWTDELVCKALIVAELLVRDPKYRGYVSKSPSLIQVILSYLDKLASARSELLAVRLISTLGKNIETRLEIGAQFSKSAMIILTPVPVQAATRALGKFCVCYCAATLS